MNDETTRFALSCRDADAPAPVLTGVQADGRLDAVLFELTLRQTYRNTSKQVLEVVYTFPLPPGAVLLGFASELNGARQEGAIIVRHVAEQRYEKSLEEGDAPVLLEAHPDGLHTANIGNLKPGDEIVLEARFAQLLSFEQGRLRVSVPTTIAPRYGNPEQAGLQPQQVPRASIAAEYPLSLTLTIGEALSGAAVECPTHRFAISHGTAGSTRLDLQPGAWLDRDVVVVVTPREPRPSLLIRADDARDPSAPVVLMAALQPPASAPRERIAVKLLVDCSGSMAGDSITSARAALRGVVADLSVRDRVSMSCFGSTVAHLFAPADAGPGALRQLRPLIDGIQADLGGTEMEAALEAVFELPVGRELGGADVLLITDGEIWQADEMIAAARRSGHRVFAIGVGSSPAEGVLRSLAESTGGASEFATPGEALEAAARRMLDRMRQPAYTNVRVDWGSAPVWTCGPAQSLFGGDTVVALAGFARPPKASAVRLLADGARGTTVELARGEADAPCPGDSLARIAAARRLDLAGAAEALPLALQYQLMSAQTRCVLVHRRAEADKATEQAELHRVDSMLAAGWGGLGSLDALEDIGDSFAGARICARSDLGSGEIRFSAIDNPFAASECAPEPFRDEKHASLETIARSVAEHLAAGGQLRGLAAHCAGLSLHADARQALDDAMQLGLGVGEAWLLLADWTNTRADGLADADLVALLQPLVSAIDPALRKRGAETFERLLGSYPVDAWVPSRMQRLRRALRRSGG